MRIVYDFDQAWPCDWPTDHEARTHFIDDGDDETLYVDYADKQFVRPVAPQDPDELRAFYQSREGRSLEEYYCGLCGRFMPISHFPH